MKIERDEKGRFIKGHVGWSKGLTREEDNRIAQPYLGKKHSKKTKDKISDAHKGKNISKKTREKMRISAIERYKRDGPPKGIFKKGCKSWNKGTDNRTTFTCIGCSKKFKDWVNRKFCSYKCYYEYLKTVSSFKKGKSWEELYGNERAKDIKRKLSLSKLGKVSHRRGLTNEEEYGKERAKEIKEKNRLRHIGKKSNRKGLVYEEIYGVERAKEIKNKESKKLKKLYKEGKKVPYWKSKVPPIAGWNKGTKGIMKSHRKGMSFEKEYGIEKAEKIKRKIRIARLKQVFPTKDTTIEILLQNELKKENIKCETHYPIFGQPDVFIEPNICIFADGDYWHANPKFFDRNNLNSQQRKEIVRDTLVTQKLINSGFVVLRFWEDEIKENIKLCINKIIQFVNNKSVLTKEVV